MARGKLTSKQARFVAEYLVDANATQAAIRSGYSAKSAETIGLELLRKTQVAAALREKQQRVANKLGVTAERVVAELARLAFSDMAKFAEWGPDGVTLKDSEELDPDDARCVAELGETRTKDGGSVRFKLHDKKGALDSLARHLGLFKDKPGADGEGGPDPIATLADLLARQLGAAGAQGPSGGNSGGSKGRGA